MKFTNIQLVKLQENLTTVSCWDTYRSQVKRMLHWQPKISYSSSIINYLNRKNLL